MDLIWSSLLSSMKYQSSAIKSPLMIISMGAYLISLALAAISDSKLALSAHEIDPGFICLLMGWLAGLPYIIPWLANPFYLYALTQRLRNKDERAFAPAMIAIVLALSSVGMIETLYIGFYVWLLSMVCLVLSLKSYPF